MLIVPARKTFSSPKSSFTYWCATGWYTPEKFKSMSGTLSPLKPRNTSKGMLKPSRAIISPQTGQFFAGRSSPQVYSLGTSNSLCLHLGHT